MEIFDEVDITALSSKGNLLTGYLEYLIDQIPGRSVTILTPRDKSQRGAQLSLRVTGDGKKIFTSLTGCGVMCDWREPNVIRVAPAPLYNTFLEVYTVAEHLQSILDSRPGPR
jgi:kynureninase